MKTRMVFMSILAVLFMTLSCQLVESDNEYDLESIIRNDNGFHEFMNELARISSDNPANLLTNLLELEAYMFPLQEKYGLDKSPTMQEAFRNVFNQRSDDILPFENEDRLPQRTFQTEYVVSADIELVWQTLETVEEYPQWNPFTPRVETTFEVGTPIIMYVRLFPLLPDLLLRQPETVVEFTVHESMCWETILLSSYFFRSHRCYEISTFADGGTILINSMLYEGLLAPFVNSLTRQLVLQGFHDVSLALKERIED